MPQILEKETAVCSQLAGTGCFPELIAQYELVFKCFIIVLLYRFIYTLSTLKINKNLQSNSAFFIGKRNPPKRVLTFWVTRHVCPGDYAARAKISSLDALAFTLFASTTRNPQSYGFGIADSPVAL